MIATVICFAIGGGLIGAWASSDNCSVVDDEGDVVCSGTNGEYYAGLAFIVIAVILKISFWITLIVYCVQRRRSRNVAPIIYVNNTAYAGNTGYGGGVEAGKATPLANIYGGAQPYNPVPQAEVGPSRFCPQCGGETVGQFCSHCGSQVHM